MKRKISIALVALILTVMVIVIVRWFSVSMREQQLLGSCLNHFDHLNMAWVIGALERTNNYELPYQAGAPGYVVFAKWSATQDGALSCNHGAPKARFGGWQVANLPPHKWKDLLGRWPLELVERIPFMWCGRPNRLGKRVIGYIWRTNVGTPSEGWYLHHEVIDEAKLSDTVSRLNRYLAEMNEPPVEVNVPNGVAWDSWNAAGLVPR